MGLRREVEPSAVIESFDASGLSDEETEKLVAGFGRTFSGDPIDLRHSLSSIIRGAKNVFGRVQAVSRRRV